MPFDFFVILMTDCVLAFLLLILFSYLSKISNNIPGLLYWGVGHFLYAVGSSSIETIRIYALEIPSVSESSSALLSSALVSSLGLFMLSYGVISFAYQRAFPSLKIALGVSMVLITFLAWAIEPSFASIDAATQINATAFIFFLLFSLRKLTKRPYRLPAHMMMFFSLFLLFTYIKHFIPELPSNLTCDIHWLNIDTGIWFLFNFCMLMMASFKTAEELRKAALHDPLTNTLNRRGLREAIDNHPLKGQSMAVIAMDLDHFKVINDTYSHAAGDAVLVAVCQQVHSLLNANDVFARVGGEEFLITLWGERAFHAPALAEEIRSHISQLNVQHQQQIIPLTTSLGVAIGKAGSSFPALMHEADRLLYQAKSLGRNRVQSIENAPEPSSLSVVI